MRLASAVLVYYLMGLACGFGLGTIRGLVLEPRLGATLATAIELPVILTLLWFGCRWTVRRFLRTAGAAARAVMGAAWLALFLASEFALGAGLRGWTPAQTLAHFQTPAGAMGLAGFVLAAVFPMLMTQRQVCR
jgi:hypothetical protein